MKALTLQRIEIFRMVYETGSITEAASRLGLAQPTVSRHLSYFEDALKLELFTNERGRIKPTWEAHRLFQECDGMFERLRHIEQTVADLQTGEGESFRIMVIPGLSNLPMLANALRTVLKSRPKLKIVVDVGSTKSQIEALHEGHIDMGIAGAFTKHPDISVDTLQKLDIVALIHSTHPLAPQPYLEWQDFGTHYSVAMSKTGPIGHLIDQKFKELGITQNTNVEVMSPPLIPSFVMSLKCCAPIDSLTADYIKDNPHLVVKPIKPPLTSHIHIFQKKSLPNRQVGMLIAQALKDEITGRRINLSE